MAIRHPLTGFSAFLLLLGAAIGARAEVWPGWHGLEKQGVAASPCCTQWAIDSNVVWKTAVPGEGHSSPIVTEDAVYLTTSFPVGMTAGGKRLIMRGVLTAAGLLALLGLGLVMRACARGGGADSGWLVRLVPFAFLMGAVIAFVFWGYRHLSADKVDHALRIARWLFSALLAMLCLVTAGCSLRARSAVRWGLGIALIAFSAVVLFARPAPEYYGLRTGAAHTQRVLQVVSALPCGVGVAVLLLACLRRRGGGGSPASAAEPDAAGSVLPRGLAAGAVALAAGLAAAGLLWLAGRMPGVQDLAIRLLQCGQMPLMVFLSVSLAAFLAWTLVWVVAEAVFSPRQGVPIPVLLRFACLGLGAFVFVDMNCLGIRRDLVRAIVCFDRRSGDIRWTAKGLRGPQSSLHQENSPATPTPVSDGERVYAYFGTAGMMCANRSGKIVWANPNLPFEDIHGVAASPVLHAGRLILLCDMPKDPYIVALDCATGQRVWRKKRQGWTGSHGCHSTPVVGGAAGKESVVVWSWGDLMAYDAQTGHKVWKYHVPGNLIGERVASPILGPDKVYVLNRVGVRALSLTKLAQGVDPLAWAAGMGFHGPNVASGVLLNGLLFTLSDEGHAACLDAETGTMKWEQELRIPAFASVVATPEAVYFCDRQGQTWVVACAPEYKLLARNAMGEPIYATPALADGQVFIRTTQHLWCLGSKPSG
jgi:outer membrane protein assembly factor BamB